MLFPSWSVGGYRDFTSFWKPTENLRPLQGPKVNSAGLGSGAPGFGYLWTRDFWTETPGLNSGTPFPKIFHFKGFLWVPLLEVTGISLDLTNQ